MFWCSIPGGAYSFGLLAIIEFSFVTSPRCTFLRLNKKAPMIRGFFNLNFLLLTSALSAKVLRIVFAKQGRLIYCLLKINICILGMGFDKFSSRWNIISHQHRKYSIGFYTIINSNLSQSS